MTAKLYKIPGIEGRQLEQTILSDELVAFRAIFAMQPPKLAAASHDAIPELMAEIRRQLDSLVQGLGIDRIVATQSLALHHMFVSLSERSMAAIAAKEYSVFKHLSTVALQAQERSQTSMDSLRRGDYAGDRATRPTNPGKGVVRP